VALKPSDGIGARVAKYRRLAGLSARELAEQAGYGLTRGVIANIESGRKTDITVDQLLALATVLGVMPVVLALPLEKPYAFVRLADGKVSTRVTRTQRAMRLFMGEDVSFPVDPDEDGSFEVSEAAASSAMLVTNLHDREKALRNIRQVREFIAEGKMTEEHLEAEQGLLRLAETNLRRLGVDLEYYDFDE
jgi:transcriptional regulator with XRE-family HTH domain